MAQISRPFCKAFRQSMKRSTVRSASLRFLLHGVKSKTLQHFPLFLGVMHTVQTRKSNPRSPKHASPHGTQLHNKSSSKNAMNYKMSSDLNYLSKTGLFESKRINDLLHSLTIATFSTLNSTYRERISNMPSAR